MERWVAAFWTAIAEWISRVANAANCNINRGDSGRKGEGWLRARFCSQNLVVPSFFKRFLRHFASPLLVLGHVNLLRTYIAAKCSPIFVSSIPFLVPATCVF